MVTADKVGAADATLDTVAIRQTKTGNKQLRKNRHLNRAGLAAADWSPIAMFALPSVGAEVRSTFRPFCLELTEGPVVSLANRSY